MTTFVAQVFVTRCDKEQCVAAMTVLSKEGRWGLNKVLHKVEYIDELQEAMVMMEDDDDPDASASTTELFALYITQRATKYAGIPLWLCCIRSVTFLPWRPQVH